MRKKVLETAEDSLCFHVWSEVVFEKFPDYLPPYVLEDFRCQCHDEIYLIPP